MFVRLLPDSVHGSYHPPVMQLPSMRLFSSRYLSTAGVPPICTASPHDAGKAFLMLKRCPVPLHAKFDSQVRHGPCMCVHRAHKASAHLTLCTSSMTYFPLGFRSAMKGTRSLTRWKSSMVRFRPTALHANREERRGGVGGGAFMLPLQDLQRI